MIRYEKVGNIIRHATPEEKKPLLTPDQVEKLQDVSVFILTLLSAVTTIPLARIASNSFSAMDGLNRKKYPNRVFSKKEKDKKITKAFYYLKRSGQIKMRLTKNDFIVSLTKIGRRNLKRINFDTLTVQKKSKWDGKWWQVAADIPTKKYKLGADHLRQKLKDMKFYPLQRTLWFYPFDPRDEVQYVADHYGVERFVTVMEISRLDKGDENLIQGFFLNEKILTA